jgi:diguanylate cyclase
MREAAPIEHRDDHGGGGGSLVGSAGQAGQAAAGQLRDKLHRLRLELAGTAVGERQARHVGWQDGLTALPSRAHFRLRLSHTLALLLRAGRPMGLLCVGLDRSTPTTAAFGQSASDELLRIVAARLRHALRASDVIGRVGRVEFACMLPDLASRQAGGKVARRLLDILAAPVRIGSIELTASANLGMAMFPCDGRGADALLDSADAAMFRARRERSEVAFFGQATGR